LKSARGRFRQASDIVWARGLGVALVSIIVFLGMAGNTVKAFGSGIIFAPESGLAADTIIVDVNDVAREKEATIVFGIGSARIYIPSERRRVGEHSIFTRLDDAGPSACIQLHCAVSGGNDNKGRLPEQLNHKNALDYPCTGFANIRNGELNEDWSIFYGKRGKRLPQDQLWPVSRNEFTLSELDRINCCFPELIG
jgi:hypothetical protein